MTVYYDVHTHIYIYMYAHIYWRKCHARLSRNQHVRSISLVENFPLVAQSSSRRDCVIGDSPCDRAEEPAILETRAETRETRAKERKRHIRCVCVSGDEMVKRSHAVAYLTRSCRGGREPGRISSNRLRRQKECHAGKYRR